MRPAWLENKKILLGVSGGIAAYKTAELARAFVKAGCEVEVVMTDAAATLVSPLTLATLTKRRVWRDIDLRSDENGWRIPHISLSGWADAFIVAPCTANVLRMAAHGDSSTLLGAAMLAYPGRIVFFPAMNENMWANPATKENAYALESRGHRIVDPDAGPLACGYDGKGRLPSVEVILDETWAALSPKRDFEGRKILITAGPTHEYIDPVRYISNPSSGKMGYALAAEARYRGADVVLVSGPVALRAPSGVKLAPVVSAREMLDACVEHMRGADVIIKAAAVGDYRARAYSERKIKRGGAETMTLELESNPDIARELSKRKADFQVLVGFAAETDDVLENAARKLDGKGLDMIVANDVGEAGSGFATDTNRVWIVRARGEPERVEGSKIEVASGILDRVALLIDRRRGLS
jgi:phosphopantothenoylcysteine decarboxylase/phosphopantothenate--cysteine ligase